MAILLLLLKYMEKFIYLPSIKGNYPPIKDSIYEKNTVIGFDSLLIELILNKMENFQICYTPFKEEDEEIVNNVISNFKHNNRFYFSFFEQANEIFFKNSSALITDLSKAGLWYTIKFLKPCYYFIPFMNNKLNVNVVTENYFHLDFSFNFNELIKQLNLLEYKIENIKRLMFETLL